MRSPHHNTTQHHRPGQIRKFPTKSQLSVFATVSSEQWAWAKINITGQTWREIQPGCPWIRWTCVTLCHATWQWSQVFSKNDSPQWVLIVSSSIWPNTGAGACLLCLPTIQHSDLRERRKIQLGCSKVLLDRTQTSFGWKARQFLHHKYACSM